VYYSYKCAGLIKKISVRTGRGEKMDVVEALELAKKRELLVESINEESYVRNQTEIFALFSVK
jgi:hypothetical protein